MQVEGNEGGMSVEQLAALLNDEPGNDPKASEASEPVAEQEVDDTESAVEAGDEPTETEVKDEGESEPSEDDKDNDPTPSRRSGSARLRAQLERARAEIEALRAGIPQQRQDVSPEDVLKAEIERRLPPMPKEEDYPGDYLAFQDARTARMTAAMMMRGQVQQEMQRAQQAHEQANRERVQDFLEAADGLSGKLPNIRAALANIPHLTDSLADIMLDDPEKGPIVGYFLHKNPDRAAALARMSPRAQAVEYGRLSASLSLPKPKAATQAAKPAPVAPVKGGGAKPSRSLADMSMDEFASRLTRDLYRG